MIYAILAMVLAPTIGHSNESKCLAEIMFSEASGESLEGLIAVAQASLNRSKGTNRSICVLRGGTRRVLPSNIAKHYISLAASIMDGGVSIVGKADSWERAKKPRYAGRITRRIGEHTFYVSRRLG